MKQVDVIGSHVHREKLLRCVLYYVYARGDRIENYVQNDEENKDEKALVIIVSFLIRYG